MKLQPIRGRESFQKLKDSGNRCKSSNFSVVYSFSEDIGVSFVVTKKIGTAVTRNRVKRRLKAVILGEIGYLPTGDYLIIAFNDLSLLSYSELKAELINTVNGSTKKRNMN